MVRGLLCRQPPPQAVTSVNNKTGAVSLSASDVGARPSSWTPTAADVGARPNTWLPTKSQVGLGNVDNVKQYSVNNPPPLYKYKVSFIGDNSFAGSYGLGYSTDASVSLSSRYKLGTIVAIGGYQNKAFSESGVTIYPLMTLDCSNNKLTYCAVGEYGNYPSVKTINVEITEVERID